MNIKNIIGIIVLGLFIIVCLQNVEEVPIHFLFWSFTISKLLLLILTLIAGIFIGLITPGIINKTRDKETK
jgi:uncharacterized integral membrane protein